MGHHHDRPYKKRLYLSRPPPDEVTTHTRVTRYIPPPAPIECMPIIEPDPEPCHPPPVICFPEPEPELEPIDVIEVDVDSDDESKCRSSKSSRRSRSTHKTKTREREVYIERERLIHVPVPVPVPVPVRVPVEPKYHTFRYVDAPHRPPTPPRASERKMITEDDTTRIVIQDRYNSRDYYSN